MGLTQASRALREEFRPLYIHALRYSIAVEDLEDFSHSSGIIQINAETRAMLAVAKESPFPTQGIDILPLINYLWCPEAKVYVSAKGCNSAQTWSTYDFASHIKNHFSRSGSTFGSRVSKVILRSVPTSPLRCDEAHCVKMVLSLTLRIDPQTPIRTATLNKIGHTFVSHTLLRQEQKLKVEFYYEAVTLSWTINRQGHLKYTIDHPGKNLSTTLNK
jgi:hypothetical protein